LMPVNSTSVSRKYCLALLMCIARLPSVARTPPRPHFSGVTCRGSARHRRYLILSRRPYSDAFRASVTSTDAVVASGCCVTAKIGSTRGISKAMNRWLRSWARAAAVRVGLLVLAAGCLASVALVRLTTLAGRRALVVIRTSSSRIPVLVERTLRRHGRMLVSRHRGVFAFSGIPR
jgi:hypothetical protein